MATVTRADDTLPVLGDQLDPTPLTDQINNILSFIESTNIDEANVDLTGTDGIVGKSTAQTITGLKTFEETSAAAGGIREVMQLGLDPVSGTPAANDGGRLVMYANDAGGSESDLVYLDWVMNTATAGQEDAEVVFRTMIYTASSQTTPQEVISFGSQGFVWNEGGYDLDARFEGNTDVNLLHVDAGNDRVGISTATPASTLDVQGTVQVGVDDTGFDVQFFGATTGKYLLWDESADKLTIEGDFEVTGTATGVGLSNGSNYINESSNTGMTIGLTINMGANDDQFFAGKSSDVNHPISGVAEADTFVGFSKANAAQGGLKVDAFTELGNQAIVMRPYAGAAPDTTHTSSTAPIMDIQAWKTDGGTGATAPTGEDAMFGIRAGATVRLLLQGEGEMHLTNTTLVALDFEDDNQLVRAMQRESAVPGTIVETEHDNPFYSYEVLKGYGLAGEKDEDGSFLIPLQRRLHAHEGAMWQTYCTVKDLRAELAQERQHRLALESRLNLLDKGQN